MQLELAKLMYGSTGGVNVKPSADLPLPTEFDFDKPEECAKHIFACMSNASGGFRIRKCKVRYNTKTQMANLTAVGVHVFYAVPNRAKRTIDEAMEDHNTSVLLELGDVRTDQYGDGWKRAIWMSSDADDMQ